MEQCDDLYKERMAALLRAVYATKYVKDDVIPAQIEEGLYLGSVGAANNKTHLKSLKVTHILTVATSLLPAYPTDFTYKVIDVTDKAEVDIAQFFDECFSFINEGKRLGGVLVHCFVGRSRSVTIVVAYLMKKHGMSLSEALNLVKSKRSAATPNSGFMLQLQNYEKSLQGVVKSIQIDPILIPLIADQVFNCDFGKCCLACVTKDDAYAACLICGKSERERKSVTEVGHPHIAKMRYCVTRLPVSYPSYASVHREEPTQHLEMLDLPRDKRSITFEVVGDQELPDLKRSKSSSVDKWSLDEEFPILFSENNPLNHPRPLGLNLKKSLILEELVEATLAQTKKDIKTRANRTLRPIDLKASNFPAVLLKIGKWEYVPKHEGDLVAKCYFAKQKLVWETLDGGLKSKIEMQWSDIVGLHANCPDHGPATLTIVLGKQPLFFRETNPQPRKHTLWQATCDFTNGEATKYMEHCLQCAPGILNKHYEKLIKYIPCLEHVSQQQGTELNFQLATKGSNKTRQVNTPRLSRNVSMSSLLNHIGHRISEKKPSPVLPFSEVSVGVNQDNMLENINSDILLSDSQLTRASDEESLMSRINSFCNLLQDGIEYSTLESLWDWSPIPMHELGSSDQGEAIN